MSPPIINYSEIIKKLTDHLDSKGWPPGLNFKKLMDRCRISLDESEPGFAFVKVERHHAICNTSYIKGVPMPAMETYSMRFAINLSNSEVRELKDISEEITIDIEGIVWEHLETGTFTLHIEPFDKKSYRIFDNVSGEQKIIATFDDAKVFVLGLVDGFVVLFEILLDHHSIEDSQKNKLITDYRKSLEEALIEKVEELWSEKESWEE